MVAFYTASTIRKSQSHFENTCHNFMHVLSQEQCALITVPDCPTSIWYCGTKQRNTKCNSSW